MLYDGDIGAKPRAVTRGASLSALPTVSQHSKGTKLMPAYNGHRSWNAWNVALWIANDEPTYRIAIECLKQSPSLDRAVALFCRVWPCLGNRTPDGAVYNRTCIREALAGLRG